MEYDTVITINGRKIGQDKPTYFIADIASNHDGDLERAKSLIRLAQESGADAVKFQHFLAEEIVSDYGFSHLPVMAHQKGWKKPVFQIYQEYECPRDWTETLMKEAGLAGIDFFTTPYDREAVEIFAPLVPAFKIGSGDITWTEFLEYIAGKGKPLLLATGASTMEDVERAVGAVLSHTRSLALLQCNTNYTGDRRNFRYVNLNVLKTFALRYPGMVLGLSDHTPGHTAVLGAIALGARIVEKHFTDDNNRDGPDHAFSMNPVTWRAMIEAARDLEAALGSGEKVVEENEADTIVVQRRCIRSARPLPAGTVIGRSDLAILRPSVNGAARPYEAGQIIGKRLVQGKAAGEEISLSDMEAF
jgi:N-acetylneuraminate synthase